MSWLNDLYLTYEACKNEAGVVKEGQPLLLPIAHLTQNAQLEVVLDEEGRFGRAYRVDKEDAVTVIPVTEDSSSRSGKAVFPIRFATSWNILPEITGTLCREVKRKNTINI